MDTFNRLTSMLLHALETREPTVDLLDSFIDHWKSITNYYIETTDDSRPVKQTDIPWRLRQMLDILVYEEKQLGVGETGPCIEYLLQHKLLETLCTLGKAQYPPGMIQQVLLFFSKLLSQMEKSLLQLVNVYRPVQKLICLCALPGSHTEKEEAQFLLVVCSRVKQDPHTLRYVLESRSEELRHLRHRYGSSVISRLTWKHGIKTRAGSPRHVEEVALVVANDTRLENCNQPAVRTHASDQSQTCTQDSSQSTEAPLPSSQSDSSTFSPIQSGSGLLSALLQLTKSQKSSVCLKAYESLLLLSAIQSEGSGEILCDQTQLGELLAGRLQELYSLLPLESLDPGEVQSWPRTLWSSQFSRCSSDLSSEPPASDHMTNFFSWFDFLDHLMREAPEVLAVKLAHCVGRLWLVDVVQSQLQHTCEQVVLVSTSVLCAAVRLVQSLSLLDQLVHFLLRTDTLTHLLLQRCDHISDQISMVSLSLVDELLQKPHRDILNILVLSFLQTRSYLSSPVAGVDDRQADSNETNEDDDDLEEDPFFSDSLLSDTQFLLPAPPLSSSAPPPTSGLGSSADIVNSFLCLVPVQVRSAQLLQEGGYESYVHDAHTLVTECRSLSQSWDWPLSLPPPSSSDETDQFFEGHLLKVLFDRLGRVLEQPYELNLQLTAVLSRLSAFNHPLLHEYMLNPYIHLSHCSRSLFSVLVRLMGELMQRIHQVSNLTDRLLNARKHLLGLNYNTGLEHLTLLSGLIVLEEFCKELAAIAFVKLPLDQQ